jgi:hypothetical protein
LLNHGPGKIRHEGSVRSHTDPETSYSKCGEAHSCFSSKRLDAITTPSHAVHIAQVLPFLAMTLQSKTYRSGKDTGTLHFPIPESVLHSVPTSDVLNQL